MIGSYNEVNSTLTDLNSQQIHYAPIMEQEAGKGKTVLISWTFYSW